MNCTNQIRQSADLLSNKSTENITIDKKSEVPREKLHEEAKKTVRCLTVLKEYVGECDDEHAEERVILPHGRYVVAQVSHIPLVKASDCYLTPQWSNAVCTCNGKILPWN